MKSEEKRPRFYSNVLKESVARWTDEDAPTHSAAIAYSMVFSLPPMLVIILWAAEVFYKQARVREAVFTEIGALVGTDGAQQLMATLEGLDIEKPTWWASAIAAVALLGTASSVLVSGQKALNLIFRVATIKPQGLGIWRMVRDRVVSLAMLVTVALILSVSLMLDATAALIGELAAQKIGMPLSWLTVVDFALIDVAGTTLLFAMLFRYLPDKQMSWSDTWFGALLTAILLAAGKSVIGFIIGSSQTATLYDAAGSILVIMLWVYYASAIFLFGASFTACRAERLAAGGEDAG